MDVTVYIRAVTEQNGALQYTAANCLN